VPPHNIGNYRPTWCRRAKFQWTQAHRQAFAEIEALITADALLAYPDQNEPFDIEIDASDCQLGAVIPQENRPFAYYSRTVQLYCNGEKELLSIVEALISGNGIGSALTNALIPLVTQRRCC
jgi:hypothetical protein